MKIIVKVPDALLAETALTIWHGALPTDPPLVPADPNADPPVEEVPAPPVLPEECIRRWIVREFKMRLKQDRREKAAKAAADALDDKALEGID